MDWLVAEFKKDNGIDLSQDPMAIQRLKEAAEKAKCELSSAATTTINLPFITADASGPKHLNVELSRAKLEQLVDDLIARSMKPVENCLRDAGLSKSQINEVILVGGMTRMPRVQQDVQKELGCEPHKGVNPDEVVAVGAAIQGGVLKGEVKDVLLLDVTPLTLGIETLGGVMTPLIERNTTIPTRKSEIFSTAADNQSTVEIHVLQGERKMANDNKTIGKFHLDGIPPAMRGTPQIEVTFDLDANGILKVSAKDLGTGKEQKITITASSGLSKEEVEKMVRDAEAHAAEDSKRKEAIDAKNRGESLVYETEKFVKENGEKIPSDKKMNLETALDALKAALKADDASRIQSASETVTSAMQAISSDLYAKARAQQQSSAGAQTPPPGGNAGGGAKPDGDVMDADFEMVDDDKKKA